MGTTGYLEGYESEELPGGRDQALRRLIMGSVWALLAGCGILKTEA